MGVDPLKKDSFQLTLMKMQLDIFPEGKNGDKFGPVI